MLNLYVSTFRDRGIARVFMLLCINIIVMRTGEGGLGSGQKRRIRHLSPPPPSKWMPRGGMCFVIFCSCKMNSSDNFEMLTRLFFLDLSYIWMPPTLTRTPFISLLFFCHNSMGFFTVWTHHMCAGECLWLRTQMSLFKGIRLSVIFQHLSVLIKVRFKCKSCF